MGDYSYNGVQPHAVTGVTNPDGLISTQPQVISYTSFNKVSEINENNNGKNLFITYGADKQRIKTVMKIRDLLQKTKYFAFDGAYEKIIDNRTGITKELCYLPGIKGYAAIYEKNTTAQTQQLHYIHRDHQGSIQCITNESGIIEEEMSFDAWGNRRNASDWTYNNVPTNFKFDRGYTGHEQLDVFGLINMNGRMYDPKLGRMLSPDIVVQDGGNTQCYNRYSYCVNNPLAYTDPSGYEARCYLDDLMFWRERGGYGPNMRNDALYNLSTGNGSVFDYLRGMPGGEYITGPPTQAQANSSGTIVVNGVRMSQSQAINIINRMLNPQVKGGNNNNLTASIDGCGMPGPARDGTPWDLNNDGVLSLFEANTWYRFGNGVAITVDPSYIDLSNVNPDLLINSGNKVVCVNLSTLGPLDVGLVYGKLDLIYAENNQVTIVENEYDFRTGASNGNPWFESFSGFGRNVGTEAGGMVAGFGTPYMINFTGGDGKGNLNANYNHEPPFIVPWYLMK